MRRLVRLVRAYINRRRFCRALLDADSRGTSFSPESDAEEAVAKLRPHLTLQPVQR